jgi:hypothetical protein
METIYTDICEYMYIYLYIPIENELDALSLRIITHTKQIQNPFKMYWDNAGRTTNKDVKQMVKAPMLGLRGVKVMGVSG